MVAVFVCLALLVIAGAVLVKERRSMLGDCSLPLVGCCYCCLAYQKYLFGWLIPPK